MVDIVEISTQIIDWVKAAALPPKIAEWVAMVPPEYITFVSQYYGLPVVAALFVGRTASIVLLRSLGLSHPNHYRHWPRLPWRGLYNIWLRLTEWFEVVFRHGKVATGGFAGALNTLTQIYTPKTLFLGRAWAWGVGLLQPIGMVITRHVFVYAMTGGGKTVGLISALQCWQGSAWLIDPKGQITEALQRNDRRDWVVLNPYDPANSAQWNPFDDIKAAMHREGNDTAVKWAVRVAEALIVTPSGSKTPYFTDTSRGFVASLILHILSFHDAKDHNLGFMRELIVHGLRVIDEHGNLDTTPEEARELLYKLMRQNTAHNGAVVGGAAAFAEASGETTGNLLSTLQEQTKWLDLPPVQHMLAATTRPLSDLKTRDDVVFSLCAPVLSIREELKPLMRLFTNLTAYTFESVREKKGQCLTIVDELQAQGYNQTLEVVLPVGRSYGQTFLGIAQDIEGMKAAYSQTYQAFTGNADAVLFMGSNHPSNLDYLSKALGQKTLVTRDRRTGQKTYRDVPVLNAEQIGRMLRPDSGNLIVLRAGRRALRLKNDPYYTDLPVTKYDADPEHGDRFWRSITRFLLNRKPRG